MNMKSIKGHITLKQVIYNFYNNEKIKKYNTFYVQLTKSNFVKIIVLNINF